MSTYVIYTLHTMYLPIQEVEYLQVPISLSQVLQEYLIIGTQITTITCTSVVVLQVLLSTYILFKRTSIAPRHARIRTYETYVINVTTSY